MRDWMCILMLASLPLWLSACAKPIAEEKYDVVVVSGSSGGFAAALAAGRMGVHVALIEDTPVLGGMLANGISNIDTFSYESISGIFDEFRLRVRDYYAPIMASDPIFGGGRPAEKETGYRGHQSNDARDGGRWEPHVADQIFKQMIAAVPEVRVFYDHYPTKVIMRGTRIQGIETVDKQGGRTAFLGNIVIDATHEGDIAAWAGAPYQVGREPRSPLEPHAGDILFFNETGEIMPGGTGQPDKAVVSYGLRLTIKNYPETSGTAHILASPPPGYNPSDYVQTSYDGRPTMPNGKSEMNANPVGNEMQEINWRWPEATRAERAHLSELYKNHALGFLYFLQHERALVRLGLPDDEFTDNGNVPYRVFVREARRIEGETKMSEADVNPFITGRGLIPPVRTDSIAVGHYAIDSKPVKSKVDFSSPDKGRGDFFLANVAAAFQVPYGAIVPLKVDGLLVPVAMSATHVAFSAVRMDPTWMAMGQAAGTAAALSVRSKTDPRNLDIEQLQRELLRQKCRLMFYWDVPLQHPAFAAIQWLSVHKVVLGYPDRLFRPDQPLSRAEAAKLLANSLRLWPSVSNCHFTDVPYQHWAFREVETLFDNHLLQAFGIQPHWPAAGSYNPSRDSGFNAGRFFGQFEPDKPVLWRELIESLRQAGASASSGEPVSWAREVLSGSEFGRSPAGTDVSLETPVTRGDACRLVASFMDRKGSN